MLSKKIIVGAGLGLVSVGLVIAGIKVKKKKVKETEGE